MVYINSKTFKLDGSVLYDPNNANALNGAYIQKSSLSSAGGEYRILAGSFLTNTKRLLGCSNLLAAYVAAATTMVVDNPWSFLVGDQIYFIGTEAENIAAEKAAIALPANLIGTVTAVGTGTTNYQVTLTPSAIAIGDEFIVKFPGWEFSVKAKTTVVADLLAQLKAEFYKAISRVRSAQDFIDVETTATTIIFKAKESGFLFKVTASVVGAGTFATAIAPGSIGTITITPAPGNVARAAGSKVSVINQTVAGVIAHSYYLTNVFDKSVTADLAAYDSGNIYKKALPYVDGNIVSQLPTLKLSPGYGV